jgi:nitrate/nitrite-specific signal transduction histidine kinase
MGEGDDLLAKKKEFFEAFFKKGAEFAEELLRENEKLRFRLIKVEADLAETHAVAPTGATLKELAEKIHAMEKEREALLSRFAAVETQHRAYAERFHQIERENASLASLYVATYQIHSGTGPEEVVRTVIEVLVNFVGAKSFAIFILDEEPRLLRPIAAEGMESPAAVPLGEGTIGKVGDGGQAHFADLGPAENEPRIVVPLRWQDRVVGVVAIWEFLSQKTELLDVDYELFHLLGAHAASALAAACLAAEAGGAPPLRYQTLAGLLGKP